MEKKIAYTTSRLNKNLERILENDGKRRKDAERSLNSALLSLQYSSSRFSDYRILSAKFLRQASYVQMIDHNHSKAKEYASVATTERYAELSQTTTDKHIREGNRRWFWDADPADDPKRQTSPTDFLK